MSYFSVPGQGSYSQHQKESCQSKALVFLIYHVRLHLPAVDWPADPVQRGGYYCSADKWSKMMHCDICISSIGRRHQSGRISDHKLTLVTPVLLKNHVTHGPTARTCFLWQTVNKNYHCSSSSSALSVPWQPCKTHSHTNMPCENRRAFIEPFSVSACAWKRRRIISKEPAADFLHRQIIVYVLRDVQQLFRGTGNMKLLH